MKKDLLIERVVEKIGFDIIKYSKSDYIFSLKPNCNLELLRALSGISEVKIMPEENTLVPDTIYILQKDKLIDKDILIESDIEELAVSSYLNIRKLVNPTVFLSF